LRYTNSIIIIIIIILVFLTRSVTVRVIFSLAAVLSVCLDVGDVAWWRNG